MEKMVLKRLQHHLQTTGTLVEEQAGFRANRSTEDQILKIQQDIADGLNKKPSNRTLLTLIDFSKAFDTVWHDKLIQKLLGINTPHCMVHWIKDFLTGRKAQVEIDGLKSQSFHLQAGVPQGAVISPTLFIIFINDIAENIKEEGTKISLFADDLAIWTQNAKPEICKEMMQRAIHNLERWTNDNKMTINEDKCSYLLFSNWTREAKWDTRLTINNKPIKIPVDKKLGNSNIPKSPYFLLNIIFLYFIELNNPPLYHLFLCL